jgi:mannose-6-phosphate isomerase
VFLLEVQQPSDTTYRLHDWGRVGLDGKPRPLHLDEGIRAAKPGTAGARVVGRYDTAPRQRLRRLLASRAFVLDAMRVRAPLALAPPPSVEVWAVLGGAGVVEAGGESTSASLGDCVVVLGGRGRVTWRSRDPRRDLTLLRARPGRGASRGG